MFSCEQLTIKHCAEMYDVITAIVGFLALHQGISVEAVTAQAIVSYETSCWRPRMMMMYSAWSTCVADDETCKLLNPGGSKYARKWCTDMENNELLRDAVFGYQPLVTITSYASNNSCVPGTETYYSVYVADGGCSGSSKVRINYDKSVSYSGYNTDSCNGDVVYSETLSPSVASGKCLGNLKYSIVTREYTNAQDGTRASVLGLILAVALAMML